MPYLLITGAVGSGKSLMAIDLLRSKEFMHQVDGVMVPRPLYVSGVPELKLPFTALDPNEQVTGGDLLMEREISPLIDLPKGAVVFIDECQRVFPPRSSTKTPPPNVRYFEVHRKLGHDGILVTQHPGLLDPNVRKLVSRHIHVVRVLGLNRATLFEWTKCGDPDSKASLKTALQRGYAYPKDVFNLYKSAEIHNIKKRIPKIVYMIPLLLAIGVGSVVAAVKYMKHQSDSLDKNHANSGSDTATKAPSQTTTDGKKYLDPAADAKEYVFMRSPRVAGLPATAPAYDEVTKPVTAPVPAACISNHDKCSCFTQQATPMNVPDLLCRDIVARGYFVDFDDKGGNNRRSEPLLARADAGARPVSPNGSVAVSGPSVVSFETEDGYGILGKRTGRPVGTK
ncbi:Phage-related protein [Collimonas arenae]|uniref:Phage-related protein n=1 Tax=Collimonas arenae TaxID=279058 RepID=A0A0A1FFT1_9BURK|nr:zonular occludens toxin domain-containing protein [Collimonas arenae]AIY41697.1 Phage-related protein [Collimonas arenae]